MTDWLARLPPDVAEALGAAPEDDWKLLELALAWPDLEGAEGRVASRLRVFVLARDPLDWLESRAPAWATTTGDGDSYEVLLYTSYSNLVDLCRFERRPVDGLLGALGESCVKVAARHEPLVAAGGYPQRVADGEAPGLLSESFIDLPLAQARPTYPPPAVTLVAGEWEPIGLGAIQDLVAEALGPVDLDRSPVRLAPVDNPRHGCPACEGRSFGFVADLEDQRAAMCRPHARAAERERDRRLERAAESNAEGCAAIARASVALDSPPTGVPAALARRVRAALDRHHAAGAGRDAPADEVIAEARADAELVFELEGWLADSGWTLEDFEDALDSAFMIFDWLMNVPFRLARVGLVDLAVDVGDALGRADPTNRSLYAADVAHVLAEAGRREEALARARANVEAFPDNLWALIHLGDVQAKVGDKDATEETYRQAVEAALEGGEPTDVSDAYDRLETFLSEQPGREADATKAREAAAAWERESRQRVAARRRRSKPRGTDVAADLLDLPPLGKPSPARRAGPKVGRNDPCPCGSGRKHKRCCGA